MGSHVNIDIDKFPKQPEPGGFLPIGTRVLVCFHYDASKTIGGTVVRNDTEEPGVMIFRLDDDRYVLATECMYSLKKEDT